MQTSNISRMKSAYVQMTILKLRHQETSSNWRMFQVKNTQSINDK